jgi:hypothetical protein
MIEDLLNQLASWEFVALVALVLLNAIRGKLHGIYKELSTLRRLNEKGMAYMGQEHKDLNPLMAAVVQVTGRRHGDEAMPEQNLDGLGY